MGHNSYCLSSCLAFRYVVQEGAEWKEGVCPEVPDAGHQGRYRVKNDRDVLTHLRRIVDDCCKDGHVGLLLSSGIDSAILAALMPRESQTYTIRFEADGAVDESTVAAQYAHACGHRHRVLSVTWDHYRECMDDVMLNKKSPLHAAETGIYLAAQAASSDHVTTLIVGNGADSTFGGLDQLLSRDWTFEDFVERYTFIEPSRVLRQPVSMRHVYEPYRRGEGIDVQGFLKVVHGRGIIQMFENAVTAAGLDIAAPYEEFTLDAPLDLKRIRRGESKYILRQIFEDLYPDLALPEKIPFARPMTQWMRDWAGPTRPEFRADIDLDAFSGEQRWLMYCLEKFLNLLDREADWT